MNKPARPKKITASQFWQQLGGSLESGVENFETAENAEPDSVMAAAIVESFNEKPLTSITLKKANGKTQLSYQETRWFSLTRFWNGQTVFALTGFLIIFLALLGLIYWTSLNLEEIKNRSVVRRPDGLPAFYQIKADDTGGSPTVFQPVENPPNPLAGRFVLAPVAENSIVMEKDLLRPELNGEMNERTIVPISVNPQNLSDAVTPNRKISLLLAKTKEPFDQSAVIPEVILLGIEKQEKSAVIVVALTSEQLTKINALLGSSEIFIAL